MKKLVYFLIPIAIASGCGSGEDPDSRISTDLVKNPLSASENKETDPSQLPVMELTEDHYDFGKIKEGDTAVHVYRFRNTGKSDLLISTVSASCGCTVPEYPKQPIAPGQAGEIKVMFLSAGKTGRQNKTITVVMNTIPNSRELLLTGEVETKTKNK
jgi:hypothetical protein